MSAPNPSLSATDPDHRWLGEYRKLQADADREVAVALRDASRMATEKIAEMAGDTRPGARVRTSQLQSSRVVMNKIVRKLFRDTGVAIRVHQSRAASLAEALLIRDEREIWKLVLPDPAKRAEEEDFRRIQAGRQIQATMRRIFQTEQSLSRRIWSSEALVRGQVNRIVNRHLVVGSSHSTMAKDLVDLVNPGSPGGATFRAKLLARTEINNAFHAQSIADVQERPWIDQVQWNLSLRHGEDGCVCERYAEQKYFPTASVPKKPHPQCLCTITPKIPDLDTAFKAFMSGQYSPWLP